MSEKEEQEGRKTKQVLVVRKDLNMRRGKETAQGGHGFESFLCRQLQKQMQKPEAGTYTIKLSQPMADWIFSGYTKVVCVVESEEELLEINAKAHAKGLECHLITDSGRTEFNGVPTKTCLCIGPNYADEIDPITGHLPLR